MNSHTILFCNAELCAVIAVGILKPGCNDVSRKLSDVVVLKCLLQYSCYQGTGTFLQIIEMCFRKDSRNESLWNVALLTAFYVFVFQIQCLANRHDCCDVYVDMFQKRLSERVILRCLELRVIEVVFDFGIPVVNTNTGTRYLLYVFCIFPVPGTRYCTVFILLKHDQIIIWYWCMMLSISKRHQMPVHALRHKCVIEFTKPTRLWRHEHVESTKSGVIHIMHKTASKCLFVL